MDFWSMSPECASCCLVLVSETKSEQIIAEARRTGALCDADSPRRDEDGEPWIQRRIARDQRPASHKDRGRPIRYRVGQSRGHVVKHDELHETSSGELLVTNQRQFLNPTAGQKPLSVPLGKIASFHVYENGLEVWQDGKERPYLFALDARASEICGLCLSKLLWGGRSAMNQI
ncbi:MAG: hypothetical protein ACXVIG_04780 [Halobacteriota archaeon]